MGMTAPHTRTANKLALTRLVVGCLLNALHPGILLAGPMAGDLSLVPVYLAETMSGPSATTMAADDEVFDDDASSMRS